MPITGTDHTVILVNNIDRGIGNFRDQLGMALTHRAINEHPGIQQAFFALADGSFIELIAPVDETSPLYEVAASRGEGVHVLALKVDNLDEYIAELQQRGIALIGVGSPAVFIHPKSAHGVMIQLWPINRQHRWKLNEDIG